MRPRFSWITSTAPFGFGAAAYAPLSWPLVPAKVIAVAVTGAGASVVVGAGGAGAAVGPGVDRIVVTARARGEQRARRRGTQAEKCETLQRLAAGEAGVGEVERHLFGEILPKRHAVTLSNRALRSTAPGPG